MVSMTNIMMTELFAWAVMCFGKVIEPMKLSDDHGTGMWFHCNRDIGEH